MKRLLLATAVGIALFSCDARAVTITTTNVPNTGNLVVLRGAINSALGTISNVFETAQYCPVLVSTNLGSNETLPGGDFSYLQSAAAPATNVTVGSPTRLGQLINILNMGTGSVKIARGSTGNIYPTSTNSITLGAGTSVGLLAPSLTNWIVIGSYSSP